MRPLKDKQSKFRFHQNGIRSGRNGPPDVAGDRAPRISLRSDQ